MTAAATAKTYRVSVQNGFAAGTPNQEFWYDFPRGTWNGPHTFPASQIEAYNNTFIMAPIGVLGKLFQSDSAQNATSTYVENGNQLSFTWATSMLPNTQQMAENSMIETTLHIGFPDGQQIAVYAADENGNIFSSVVLAATIATTIWGQFVWGQALWQGASNALAPRQLKWPIPIVFQRLCIIATGNCAQNLKIGDLYMRYQQLGYLLQEDRHIA
jgi:hypothetical protein